MDGDTSTLHLNERSNKGMITLSKDDTKDELSFKGLSTDSKPTQTFEGIKITNGSSFFEMDTQLVFFYNGATDSWLAQP